MPSSLKESTTLNISKESLKPKKFIATVGYVSDFLKNLGFMIVGSTSL